MYWSQVRVLAGPPLKNYMLKIKNLKNLLIRLLIIFFHLINLKRKKVFIYGIQRSGTNFLTYILTLNHLHILNKDFFRKKYKLRTKPGFVHYYHKNTLLSNRYNGKKINFKTIKNYNQYLKEPNAKHIIITRNLKSWLVSIKKYSKLNKDWKYTNNNNFYIKEYRKFYDFYKNNKNILFVKIENLTRNTKDFSKIEKFLNIKLFIKKTSFYVSLKL
jgi:hypothetical protein